MGEGASFSVTRGIVSAKNRAIDESSQVLGAIQTDAAINHGNSGGPLLDFSGKVVGVNTALAPDSTTGQAASGIGFAVGSNLIEAVYQQLKETGRVNRGFLGVSFVRGAAAGAGARPGPRRGDARRVPRRRRLGGGRGPAEAAGIRQGDVIAAIGGDPVRNETDLAVAMVTHGPGSQADLDVYRGGKKVTVSVTLGEPQA